jgi:hypothetical protein
LGWVRIPHSPPRPCFRTSKDIQKIYINPSKCWGLVFSPSRGVLWQPALGGSISGGTLLPFWGRNSKDHLEGPVWHSPTPENTPQISLAVARKRHGDGRDLLAAGIDPMVQRKTAKTAEQVATENSFASVAAQWLEHLQDDKSTRHVVALRDVVGQNDHGFGRFTTRNLTQRLQKA